MLFLWLDAASLYYCYDVFVLMLICIRRSKDFLEQFQELECNNSFFAFDSCVYCTTHHNKCGRIGTIWLYFFAFIKECCVMMKKNIGKKLANRISHQIWYKRCLKGKFSGGRGEGGGPNLRKGFISAGGFEPGRGVQSAVTLDFEFISR